MPTGSLWAPAVSGPVDAMLAMRGNPEAGPLFVTRRGGHLYVAWPFRLVKRLGNLAHVPQAADMSAHSLRATAITEALDAGVPLRDVQDLARHRDPRTTRRYDKARGDLDRSASYVLAGRLGGAE